MEATPAHGARGTCSAKTRAGTPCKRVAGWGTPGRAGRCSWHGGATPSGRAAAAREEVLRDAQTFGVELRDVDPLEALLVCVMAAAARLRWVRERSAEVRVPAKRVTSPEVLELARLERHTVELLARASKAAIDAGVAERQVRLAERQAEVVAAAGFAAFEAACRVLGVTPTNAAQTEYARAFGARLRLLEEDDGERVPAVLNNNGGLT